MDTRCFKLHRSYLISLWAKPKRPYLSLEKEKENFCEIRTFHVAVVQQRLRNALRSVMNVQSCSFASLNLLLFLLFAVAVAQTLYRAFSDDVRAAISVFQNNKTAAMLVLQTNPLGVELFSYVNSFFCSHKFAQMLVT